MNVHFVPFYCCSCTQIALSDEHAYVGLRRQNVRHSAVLITAIEIQMSYERVVALINLNDFSFSESKANSAVVQLVWK